ncbi:MAG TPA: site-specific integrase [Candidatus Angelobacter sp.]|jgi:integrase|nr:site-specific integrase [Candidatus Angelobacter sp.]
MGRQRANHEGSIDHFRDGYRGRITIERSQRTVYGKTRADVAQQLRDIRKAAEHGVQPDAKTDRMTVANAVELWGAANELRCRPNTQRYYDQRMAHILPAIGGMRLRKVTADHLNDLHRQKLQGGDLTSNGVQKLRTVESIFFNWCKKRHLVTTNPASESEPIRKKKFRATRLSAEEAIRLLNVVKDDRLAALVFTGLTTAMRGGELLGLLWEDIDFDRAVIEVRHELVRSYDRSKRPGVAAEAPAVDSPKPDAGATDNAALFVIDDVKTDDSERTIPLIDLTVDVLQAHRRRQAAERLRAPSWQNPDLVFSTELGTPFASWNVTRSFFRPALEKARCPPIRLYDMRHSSATLLHALRVPIEVISSILGHSGLDITLSTYVEILEQTKRDALMKLGDRLQVAGLDYTMSAARAPEPPSTRVIPSGSRLAVRSAASANGSRPRSGHDSRPRLTTSGGVPDHWRRTMTNGGNSKRAARGRVAQTSETHIDARAAFIANSGRSTVDVAHDPDHSSRADVPGDEPIPPSPRAAR